jgi:hypothetical protein
MNNTITIYLSTCDKTSHILPATIFLYKKFINTITPHFKILGFTKPNLPDWENVEFISLSSEPQDLSQWSIYLFKYFCSINDELIFLALDDFFPINFINTKAYNYVFEYMTNNQNVGFCVVGQEPNGGADINELKCVINETEDIFIYERKKHINYQLVLQPGIWNRQYLCAMLSVRSSPWEFELNTTYIANNNNNYFNISSSKDKEYKKCILSYCTNSALSSKWNGICVLGLKHEYINELINNNLITCINLMIGCGNIYKLFDTSNRLNKTQFISMCLDNNMNNWVQLYSDYY